jgi:hypothetical protein
MPIDSPLAAVSGVGVGNGLGKGSVVQGLFGLSVDGVIFVLGRAGPVVIALEVSCLIVGERYGLDRLLRMRPGKIPDGRQPSGLIIAVCREKLGTWVSS